MKLEEIKNYIFCIRVGEIRVEKDNLNEKINSQQPLGITKIESH